MDADLLWALREARLPVLVVATKMDKLKRLKGRAALERLARAYTLGPTEIQAFSALKGTGLDELRRSIDRAVKPPR